MPAPRGRTPRGMKPAVENPGKILKRLLSFIFKNYGVHMVIVFLCIAISVIANLQGTMFMKSLIDDYIEPMVEHHSHDFGPLIKAILRTAAFYGIGIASTYAYNRIMVEV